jgi:hypothetical protein
MEGLVSESASTSDGPRGIQDPAQGLIHGPFIRKSFRNLRLQHNDIGSFAKPL